MKFFSVIFLTFSASLLLASSGVVPPGDWVAEGYQYNMTYYAQVLRPDGTYIDHERSVLAVFDKTGECRGAISPIDGPNERLYQLSIASNNTVEQGLVFKVLDAVTGETYPIAETVVFANDAIVPEDGIIHPLQLHVPDGCLILRFQPGWNLVSFPFTPDVLEQSALLALHPFEVKDNAYIHASALVAFHGYWFNVQEPETYVLAPGDNVPELTLTTGWNLVGVASDRPAWLGQVTLPFFRWDPQVGFVTMSKPALGQGYWIKQ